jgi:hypothetical protein
MTLYSKKIATGIAQITFPPAKQVVFKVSIKNYI